VAHSYAFQFDRSEGAFVAQAHGDLDGDGTTSTFEIRGKCDRDVASLVPGLYVESELE
jgi:hypothetical protein